MPRPQFGRDAPVIKAERPVCVEQPLHEHQWAPRSLVVDHLVVAGALHIRLVHRDVANLIVLDTGIRRDCPGGQLLHRHEPAPVAA